MAFIVAANGGPLNGTTHVTVAPAPGAGVKRVCKSMTVMNKDTANITVNICVLDGATLIYRYTSILAPGFTFSFDEGEIVVLDTTSKSLVAFLSAPIATTQPDFLISWGDAS